MTNSTSNITQLPWTVEPGGLHDAKCGVDAVEAKLMMKHRGSFRGSVSVGDRLSLHTLAPSHCLGFSAVQVLRLHNTADGGISQQCEITVFNSPTSVFLTARIMWGKLLIVLWKSVITIANIRLSQNGINVTRRYVVVL